MDGIPGIGEVAVLEQPQHLRRGRAAQLACRRGGGGGLGRAAADGPLAVLGEELERRGEVPHLDGARGVARDDEAPRPRPDPAGALALVHAEGGDGRPVDGADDADALPVARQPHELEKSH